MKKLFRGSSIRHKLTGIILFSCLTILMLTFSVAFIYQWRLYQRSSLEELLTLAKITSENSTAALVFEDYEALNSNLLSLSQKNAILCAAIFRADGSLAASYSRGGMKIPFQQLQKDPTLLNAGHDIAPNHIDLLHTIVLDGEKIGQIYLRSSLNDLKQALAEAGGYLLLIIGGGLIVAVFLANWLQRIITRPVTELAATIAEVSKNKNYSLRVQQSGQDELGLLAAGFNEMLDQIRLRDAGLEEQVRDRTAQLEKAKDEAIVLAQEAQAASRAKSQFLANMSHEIRTPMNGVLGMAEIVLETELTRSQRDAIETIRSSGESLLTVINDILDFSKIEAGKLEIETINFNLPALIDDVAQMLAHRAHAKGLELIVEVTEEVHPEVSGDPSRIRQVLANLIANAVKFTDSGEVHVKTTILNDSTDKVWIRFLVRDTGIGMTEEEREKLFQPFSQADESTTRRYGGTGLGLAISRQLVELMNGRIDCTSRCGRGSEFWFDLELKKTGRNRVVARAPADELKGIRALIVDDNATNRNLLTQFMSNWGVENDSAANGREALTKLHDTSDGGHPFDVVILDMHMPDMDGLDVARLIREDPELGSIKMAMLTSVGMRGDARLARQTGISLYLTKPVRQTDLYNSLVALLKDGHTSSAELMTRYNLEKDAITFNAVVLLAEDNLVNQQVAKGVLRNLGCRVDLAMNGAEALSLVDSQNYDMIFMDCQMPGMDGYAATVSIRNREADEQSGRRVPIVALTANALSGDREKCLAAGMDDYISKPFNQQRIAAVLQRWLPREKQAAANPRVAADEATGHPSTPQPAATRLIDRRSLEAIRSLQPEGQPDILEKIIGIFFEDTSRQLSSLRQAIAADQAQDIRAIAHSLKSSSANLGALVLAELFKQLEEKGRTAVLTGARELFTEAEEVYHLTCERLKAEIDNA